MLKTYELWALVEDGVREVHPSARVRLLGDFREDNFHTHFFNAQRFQIPFLGHRSVNMSAEFLDTARATQQVGSCVTSWTENIFVHSWGTYPTMIPRTISTLNRRASNVAVTPHALALRANHERLQLNRVERRPTFHRYLLALILQDMRDKACAVLSNDYNDGWLEGYDSDQLDSAH